MEKNMNYRINRIIRKNELYHHGILGQKWGVRRFQNKDGSYTAAGKSRHAKAIAKKDKINDKTVAKFETSLKNYWEASVDNANDMKRTSKNIVIVNKDKQALVDKALKEVDALGYKMNKEFEWADTGSYHVKEGKAYVSYMLRSSTGKIYMKDIKLGTKPNSEFETIKQNNKES